MTREEYGETPRSYLEKFGIDAREWGHLGSVSVLRSCILTPYFTSNTTYEDYWRCFMGAMERAIGAVAFRP